MLQVSPMSFNGFPAQTLALLPELPAFDERTYGSHRKEFADNLRKPGLALITSIAESLGRPLVVDARSSVSPLHRDLRFAKAGTARYKDHLLLTTWQGSEKSTSPVLWIRVDANSVGFASGIAFTPAIRNRWREAVAAESGSQFAQIIESLAKKHASRSFEVDGPQLKRVPKPWDPTHPREALLRQTGFQARFIVPLPKAAHSASFTTWCSKKLSDLLPVHDWLVDELKEGN